MPPKKAATAPKLLLGRPGNNLKVITFRSLCLYNFSRALGLDIFLVSWSFGLLLLGLLSGVSELCDSVDAVDVSLLSLTS